MSEDYLKIHICQWETGPTLDNSPRDERAFGEVKEIKLQNNETTELDGCIYYNSARSWTEANRLLRERSFIEHTVADAFKSSQSPYLKTKVVVDLGGEDVYPLRFELIPKSFEEIQKIPELVQEFEEKKEQENIPDSMKRFLVNLDPEEQIDIKERFKTQILLKSGLGIGFDDKEELEEGVVVLVGSEPTGTKEYVEKLTRTFALPPSLRTKSEDAKTIKLLDRVEAQF